jgi:hypothetical protein
MHGRVTSLLGALILTAACGGTSSPPASAPSPGAPATAGGSGVASTQPTPAAGLAGDAPAPAPALDVSCANGGLQASGKEINDALRPLNGTFDYDTAFPVVSKLAAKYPASAHFQKTLGKLEFTKSGASSFTPLTGDGAAHAKRAVGFLKQALALHDRGCEFSDQDTSNTMSTLAMAYVASGDYAASVAEWKALLAKWPTDAQQQMDYAEALCENGDATGCADGFQKALDVTFTQHAPAFTNNPQIELMVYTSRDPSWFSAIKKSGVYAKILKQEEAKTGRSFQAPAADTSQTQSTAPQPGTGAPQAVPGWQCRDNCTHPEFECEGRCDCGGGYVSGQEDQYKAQCEACKQTCKQISASCAAACPP